MKWKDYRYFIRRLMQENGRIKFSSEKLITCWKLILLCNLRYIIWSFFPKDGKHKTNSSEMRWALRGTKSTAGEGTVSANGCVCFYHYLINLFSEIHIDIDAAKIQSWKQKNSSQVKTEIGYKVQQSDLQLASI